MTRHYLINTAHKDVVQSAAKAQGAQCVSKVFSSGDLERLKAPVLIVFDSDRAEDLTPDILQSLRRSHRNGIRYAPALVICARRDEMSAWRAGGAVAIHKGADRNEMKAAVQEAINGMRAWVTAANYVGPCRRRHKAVLAWRSRRTADGVKPAASPRAQATAAPRRLASIEVLYRRLSLSVTLLSGSTIESRRAFRDLAEEFHAAVHAHNRQELSHLTHRLCGEAEAFLQNGQRPTDVVEQLVRELGRQTGRGV